MCKGLIHHCFPDRILLSGVIALEEGSSGHQFFQSMDANNLQGIKQRLLHAGAKDVALFEGYKQQLIEQIRSLNTKAGLPGYNPVAEFKRIKAA